MFAMETLAGVPLLFNKTRRRRAICKANRRGTNKKRTSTWMSSFYCKGRLKSIFLFLVQKAPQLIKQGRSAQCQLPVLGQYSTQADRSDSVPHSGNALHFPM